MNTYVNYLNSKIAYTIIHFSVISLVPNNYKIECAVGSSGGTGGW